MQTRSLKSKFFGDKAFYAMILGITVPIIVQNAITNFVSLLDNIMVGRLGTEQMSGVAIGNQLLFVYNLCIFGGYSGAGIFTAQYHGKGDDDGIRYTMRFKLLLGAALTALAAAIFLLWDGPLINLFLHDGSASGDLAQTLAAGQQYLAIMLWGLVPFALGQVYISTLREVGETVLPMKAGIAAVLVNLFFNWVLIYGHLGFAPLGVRGAAIATVLSRFVECGIVILWTHRHHARFGFMRRLWRSLYIPAVLVRDIVRRGLPLLFNEGLWSLGMTTLTQCYSTRGLAVIAGLNIASTIVNLFNVVYMSLGNALGIVVGKLLGQGKTREAVDTDRRMIAFGVLLCVGIGSVMAATAGLFPQLYNTTDEVRGLATYFIRISGLLMPAFSFLHCAYFTLRCGGKTVLTFFFDCGFICLVNLPFVYVLSHFTGIDIHLLYFLGQSVDLFKCLIGFVLVKKGVWINNIVGGTMEE